MPIEVIRPRDIHRLIDPRYHDLIDGNLERAAPLLREVRAQLEAEGCAVLRDFLAGAALDRAAGECASISEQAYTDITWTNAYNTADDPSLPADDPRRIFMERSQGFVSRDRIPPGFVIAQLYSSQQFQRAVALCMAEPQIHEYADPLAGLVVNVLHPGATHPWHYDTNEFIASLMTRAPSEGGCFEYCPNIRSAGDERYDVVGKVIRGEDRSPVRRLQLRPGDLQLFRGRFALHRVTRVAGDRTRLTAIFAYAKQPGMVGRSERSRQLFGRTTDKHAASDRTRRADDLLD